MLRKFIQIVLDLLWIVALVISCVFKTEKPLYFIIPYFIYYLIIGGIELKIKLNVKDVKDEIEKSFSKFIGKKVDDDEITKLLFGTFDNIESIQDAEVVKVVKIDTDNIKEMKVYVNVNIVTNLFGWSVESLETMLLAINFN